MSVISELLGEIVIQSVTLSQARSNKGGILNVVYDLLGKLTVTSDFDIWLEELKRFCRKEPCWVPKLPYTGEILAMFLRVAKVISLYPEKIINEDGLIKEMRPLLALADRHYDFFTTTASYWLSETDKLGITRNLREKGHKIIMLPQEIECIFGVKLMD